MKQSIIYSQQAWEYNSFMVLQNQRKYSQLVNAQGQGYSSSVEPFLNRSISMKEHLSASPTPIFSSDLMEAQLQGEMKGAKLRPSPRSSPQDCISKAGLTLLWSTLVSSPQGIPQKPSLLTGSSEPFDEANGSSNETSWKEFWRSSSSLSAESFLDPLVLDLLVSLLRMKGSLLSSSRLKSGLEKARCSFARWLLRKPYMLSWRTKLLSLEWRKQAGSICDSKSGALRMAKEVPLLLHNKILSNSEFCYKSRSTSRMSQSFCMKPHMLPSAQFFLGIFFFEINYHISTAFSLKQHKSIVTLQFIFKGMNQQARWMACWIIRAVL